MPETPETSVAARLRERIETHGPISVAAFMTEALFHPRDGYYATKNPIGAGEDFITAPSISQMFGELVGLWSAQVWMDMGRPDPFQLVELGPGTGAMMSDAVRAGRAVPGFLDAAQITLIEASAALKSVQAKTLTPAGIQLQWADRLETIPPGPALIWGNEFLDCLPVRQAVRVDNVWRERMVTLDADGFAFTAGAAIGPDEALIPDRLRDAANGALVELRPGDRQLIDALRTRFGTSPGAALFIDYGPAIAETGDTLQALRSHKKVDPLDNPGTADLTARVDFESLDLAAKNAGLTVFGPVTQKDFLLRLGIENRAAALLQQNPDHKSQLARQLWRLTDSDQMGDLFKVIVVGAPDMPQPPGF